jgi:hypothetical protein
MNLNKLLKLLLLLVTLTLTLTSCKSNRDDCIDALMKEEGYDYDAACEACDEEASDNMRYED